MKLSLLQLKDVGLLHASRTQMLTVCSVYAASYHISHRVRFEQALIEFCQLEN